MNDEVKPFSGDFIRHKRFCAYKYLLRHGYRVNFDVDLYSRVSSNIISVLGEKKRYTVNDAVFYFQTKYQAHRIPWEYSNRYIDTSECYPDFSPSCRGADSMTPFDYSGKSKERNVTLVVDTVFNTGLRESFCGIAEMEKQMQAVNKTQSVVRCNPIIVIGYIKANKINSMFYNCHFYLNHNTEYPTHSIPDINYEMWYFYNHS